MKVNKEKEKIDNTFILGAKRTLSQLDLLPESLGHLAKKTRESARAEYEAQIQKIADNYADQIKKAKRQYERLVFSVREKLAKIADTFEYPQKPWSDKAWDNFEPPQGFTEHQLIRVGTLTNIHEYKTIDMPWLLPLLGHNNVLIKVSGRAKEAASALFQTIILRSLASLPPGRLRMTFIDPVSYGRVFGGFMTLSKIIKGEGVWREKNHIHEQFLHLSGIIAFVIQNFLKNKFASIEEYNRHVQEIEEPYRLLAIYNFPEGFDSDLANRLISIAENGNRTGVYTLVMVDAEKKCPRDFDMKRLEKWFLNITYDSAGHPVWKNSPLPECRYIQDPLPDKRIFETINGNISETFKKLDRVKVPFEAIAGDTLDHLWQGRASGGIRIPVGKAGTDRQFFTLGESGHHALIGGMTGMGKSVFLHNLILMSCLYYPPDELELCLIDFREGVEFMKYATHQLPHASVVAIETEREFGYSILQKLNNELQERGRLFKEAGSNITQLSHFNKKYPDNIMPRILLILDEFQELLTEDDSLARETASIIDRLARKGRSYGINLILSTQTLTGYSKLPSGAKGQMPIRIAFSCDDSASREILSDDNPEAKFLTKKGEAIYNDSKGLVRGNNKFQVAWLSNEKIEKYLLRIQEMAKERGYKPPHPQIVFNGKDPGKISKNVPFYEALKEKKWKENAKKCIAWLGESIAIKPHTHAMFSRQSGSNLLFIGKDVDVAASTLLTAILSIASQQSPEDASFFLANFLPRDREHLELFFDLDFMLDRHEVKLIHRQHDLPETISALHEVLTDRLQMDQQKGTTRPSIYLFLMGVQRARILQKQGYDLTEGSKKLVQIFQDGPDVGIHSMIWSDNYTNFVRAFDRALHHFDMRVLLPMNADDSNMLIGSSVASKLKDLQAVYLDEGRTHSLEKFKPYGLLDKAAVDEILCFIRKKEIQS